MKYLFLSVAFSCLQWLSAQSINFKSNILGEHRTVWISTPQNLDEQKQTCIYLIGARANDFRASILQDEFICIGIESQDIKADFLKEEDRKQYLSFLTQELIPYVDGLYPTIGSRFISGHSLAGALVIEALIKAPQAYSFYIATSPALHSINCASIDSTQYSHLKGLYFNIGSKENYPQLSASNHALHFKLDSLKTKNLQWKFEVMKDETHETNAYTGFCRALTYYRSLTALPDSLRGESIDKIITYTNSLQNQYGVSITLNEKVVMSNILINLDARNYGHVQSAMHYLANNYSQFFSEEAKVMFEIIEFIEKRGKKDIALDLFQVLEEKTDHPSAEIKVIELKRGY